VVSTRGFWGAAVIVQGHVLDRLAEMPEGSVHCIVTSAPYHGLRDYSRCPCTVRDKSKAWFDFEAQTWFVPNPDDEENRKDPDPACPTCHGTGRVEGLVHVWGTKEECEHEWGEERKFYRASTRPLPPEPGGTPRRKMDNLEDGRGKQPEIDSPSSTCLRCGAWRGMLGLEPTFSCGAMEWGSKDRIPCASCYLCHAVLIGRALRRVLREDGTLWWNQGDSYTSGDRATYRSGVSENKGHQIQDEMPRQKTPNGLKPGDLIDQSGRVANALEADGWTWRQRIVWAKPNPMPESTEDRPTRSHEFILLFAKAAGNTYWTHRDGRGAREAPGPDYRWVREIKESDAEYATKGAPPGQAAQGFLRENSVARDRAVSKLEAERLFPGDRKAQAAHVKQAHDHNTGGRPKRTEELPAPPPEWQAWYDDEADKRPEKATGWRRVNLWTGHRYYYDADAVREKNSDSSIERAKHHLPNALDNPDYDSKHDPGDYRRFPMLDKLNPAGRNLRDIWTIPTHSFPDAHFATFPPALVERPIKAGTSERGCCVMCGAPWERVVSTIGIRAGTSARNEEYLSQGLRTHFTNAERERPEVTTLGWQPTCEHFSDPCAKCAKPWREVRLKTVRVAAQDPQGANANRIDKLNAFNRDIPLVKADGITKGARTMPRIVTVESEDGYPVRLPACFCGLVPCTVLDPFAGSGTVGVVALELGRRFVGIEANPLYVRMAEKRIAESREGAHPVAVVATSLGEFG